MGWRGVSRCSAEDADAADIEPQILATERVTRYVEAGDASEPNRCLPRQD